MDTKKNKIPKFMEKYPMYQVGANVTNPFSGQSYELNELELSIYAMILNNERVGRNIPDMHKGLMWFRKNNVDAYYVLLD